VTSGTEEVEEGVKGVKFLLTVTAQISHLLVDPVTGWQISLPIFKGGP
jgi:hypothetical protein